MSKSSDKYPDYDRSLSDGLNSLSSFSNTVTERPYHDYGTYLTTDGKRRDLVICDSNPTKTPLYFVRMAEGKKPDMRLYPAQHTSIDPDVNSDGRKLKSEQAKKGSIVAVAHFPAFSRRTEMGFGNPDRPDSVRWETLKRARLGVYEFSMPLIHDKQYSNNFQGGLEDLEDRPVEDKVYQWQRTHSTDDGLDNAAYARYLSNANYKLVNEQGEIIALFISNGMKSWNKRGKLRIFKDHLPGSSSHMNGVDKEMELRIIFTYCALEERARR